MGLYEVVDCDARSLNLTQNIASSSQVPAMPYHEAVSVQVIRGSNITKYYILNVLTSNRIIESCRFEKTSSKIIKSKQQITIIFKTTQEWKLLGNKSQKMNCFTKGLSGFCSLLNDSLLPVTERIPSFDFGYLTSFTASLTSFQALSSPANFSASWLKGTKAFD